MKSIIGLHVSFFILQLKEYEFSGDKSPLLEIMLIYALVRIQVHINGIGVVF